MVFEVEDSSRATSMEEAVSILAFDFGRQNRFFFNATSIPADLLFLIRKLTGAFEVNNRLDEEWSRAILDGFGVWRRLCQRRGGVVIGDLRESLIKCE
jgi:hypothetical protein